MENIFNDIRTEREKQVVKWGLHNHPILDPQLLDQGGERMCEEYEIPSEIRAKQIVERLTDQGRLTHMHILIEEISEAVSCGPNTEELRKELIQSAAVIVAMIESIDRATTSSADKHKIIEAFGLKTRTWTFNEKYGYGCAECCTGDRCDEDCNSKTTPYHGRRKDCPHCKGEGWIKIQSLTNHINSPTANPVVTDQDCDHYFAEALGSEICIYCRQSRGEIENTQLEIGLQVVFEGKKGTIIKMEGYGHTEPHYKKEDYVVIELDKPNEHDCKILEVLKKSLLHNLNYPNNGNTSDHA